MLDLLIRGGTIVDGSGEEPYGGDVAVHNGKITEVGPSVSGEAARVVDAAGCLVTPGFVDAHRHADGALFRPGFGEIELRQGITTIVNGNCGLSVAPAPRQWRDEMFDFLAPIVGPVDRDLPFETFGQYMDLAEGLSLPLNVGCCVGDGALRMAAKGFADGRLSQGELRQVHRYLEDALAAGALGVTMGIAYMPEGYYDIPGFLEALAPIRGLDLPLVTHMRGEGNLLHEAIREVAAVAAGLSVPLHVSHFKAVGRQNWGQGLRQGLALLDRARQHGVGASCDVYPYTAGSSQLIQLLPPEFLEGGVPEILRRLRDPAERRRLTAILKEPRADFENLLLSTGWENILLTTLEQPQNRAYLGKSVAEIAVLLGKDPYDCAYDLLVEEACNVAMVAFYMSEEDVVEVMNYSHSLFISDSLYPAAGLPHPRLYGAFPRFLAKYVRDDKAIPLPMAVRKMTAMPAELYRLAGKGRLAPGYDADVAVFRLEDVKSPATYTDSRQLAGGFRLVLVAGQVAVEEDCVTFAPAGKVLRRT